MRVPNETSRSARRPWAIAVAILVAVPLAAGIGQAAIPDTNTGEITVCYKPYTGQMRLIDTDSASCASDEDDLSWNQQGPPGLSGFKVETGRDPAGFPFANSDSPKTATAECAPGTKVIGTGVNVDGGFFAPTPPLGHVVLNGVAPIGETKVRATAAERSPRGRMTAGGSSPLRSAPRSSDLMPS